MMHPPRKDTMTSLRPSERGEGKIGCFISLIVMALAIALALKIVPVFFSNSGLVGAAEDLGSRAGILPVASLEQQLRSKAVELEIPEALAKGAMTFSVLGDKSAGTCVVRLRFTRKVDLYGVYTLEIPVDKTISRPYMDAR